MSTTPNPPSTPTEPPIGTMPNKTNEIKLISHSTLFYWWPVWFLSFVMAIWTYFENNRLAIVPANSQVVMDGEKRYTIQIPERSAPTDSLTRAVNTTKYNQENNQSHAVFRPRISSESWLGAVFIVGLLLTILITNVPMRGLWSFLVIIMIVVLVLFISLFKAWDQIFDAFGNLHIHINMAGYLFIGTAVLVMWLLATFVFDRRSYIIFTPGQIRVCEHIGASVQTYNTFGVGLEKQRDDLFRHYILGFGSGDLIVRTGGADKHEIKLPNVLGIGWRLKSVEDMIRQIASAN